MSAIGDATNQKRTGQSKAVTGFGRSPSQMTPAERMGAVSGYELQQRLKGIVRGVTTKKIRHIFTGQGAATNEDVMLLPHIAPTKMFTREEAEVLIGYALHEASHHLETDFSLLERILADDPPKLEQKREKEFWNAIEDYRIEKITRQAFPGIPTFIDRTRHYATQQYLTALENGAIDPRRINNPYAYGAVALTWLGAKMNGYRTLTSEKALATLNPNMRQWIESWESDMAAVETCQDAWDLARKILQDLDEQMQDENDSSTSDTGDSKKQQQSNNKQQQDQQQRQQQKGQPEQDDQSNSSQDADDSKQGDTESDSKGKSAASGNEKDQDGQKENDPESDVESGDNAKDSSKSDNDGDDAADAADTDDNGDADADANDSDKNDGKDNKQEDGTDSDDGSSQDDEGDSADQSDKGDGKESDDQTTDADKDGQKGESESDAEDGSESDADKESDADSQSESGAGSDSSSDAQDGADNDGHESTGADQSADGTNGNESADGDNGDNESSGDTPDKQENSSPSTPQNQAGDETQQGDGGSGDDQTNSGENKGESNQSNKNDSNANSSNGANGARPPLEIEDGMELDPTEASDLEIPDIIEKLKNDGRNDQYEMEIEEFENCVRNEVEFGLEQYTEMSRQLSGTAARSAGVIRRLLAVRDITRTRNAVEEGQLDLSRLVPIINGASNIYKSKTVKRDVNTAVSILVDQSGSMMDHKIRICQQACIILDQGIVAANTDLEITGFTGSSCNPTLYRFRSFGEKGRIASSRIGLMHKTGGGGTPMALPILDVWTRLKNHKAPRKILIMITDGMADDMVRTKEAHDLVVNAGGSMLGIAIGDIRMVSQWCDNAIQLDDVEQLPTVLTQLIQNAIMTKRAA